MKKALITFAITLNLILASVLMPFSHKVYAASVSGNAPIIGVNVTLFEYDRVVTRWSTEFDFDVETVGAGGTTSDLINWRCTSYDSSTGGCRAYQNVTTDGIVMPIQIDGEQTYINNSTAEVTWIWQYEFVFDGNYAGYVVFNTSIGSATGLTYYVNGSSLIVTEKATNPRTSFTISDYNLRKLDPGQTWLYPVESFTNILTLFNAGFEQVGIDSSNNYLYPIFQEDSTKQISNTSVTTTQKKCVLVMYTSRSVYNATTFNNFFTYNSNFTISDFKYVQRSTSGWIINVTFENTSSSTQTLNLRSANSTGKFTVIYNTIYYDSYPVSTDFALQFGLTNDLLSTLNVIANGTSGSNSTVSNFNQTEQTMNNTIDDYNEIENSFTDDFEENITAINPSDHGLSLMGSKFLNSANWVKTQFDRITTGTPFGSILGFSLVLGLGLLIIGRVFG